MKQNKKLHPFMDHLKKAKKQNAEFCSWLAMAEEAFNNGNAERAYEYALRAYEKTERTTLVCRMIPAYFFLQEVKKNKMRNRKHAMFRILFRNSKISNRKLPNRT